MARRAGPGGLGLGQVIELASLAGLDPRGHLGAGEGCDASCSVIAVADGYVAAWKGCDFDAGTLLLGEAADAPTEVGVVWLSQRAPP
jgi:hypothetical protein